MAKKDPAIVGLWAELVDMFTSPMLASMLGCSESDLDSMAKGIGRSIPVELADKVNDLCHLHGIKPSLYQYRAKKHRENTVISCQPDGWQVWSLDSGYGWAKHSRWFGNTEELKLADDGIIQRARLQGWV